MSYQSIVTNQWDMMHYLSEKQCNSNKPGRWILLKVILCYHSHCYHDITMKLHPLLCPMAMMKQTFKDIPALEPAVEVLFMVLGPGQALTQLF